MSANTTINSGDLVTFTIRVNGTTIPDEEHVYSVHVETGINQISTAIITILDGDPSSGKFEASSSSTFVPGNTITIEAGYDTKNTVIFKGIITQQSIRIDEVIGSALVVECRDEAIKLIVGRKSLTYANKKDSEIISTILGNYSGLSSNVTGTSIQWPEQVQYYTTDWDFILSRAEANGMIVTTLNNTVSVIKPDANTSPVLTIKYGDGLMEFNADLNAITQLGTVKANTWDYKTQGINSGQASNTIPGPGNISSKKLSEVVGLSDYQLQTNASVQTDDLTNWSNAQMIKSELAKIRGKAKFQGTALVEPAKYMTFQGLGDRFNGDHLISGVVHTISNGKWLTTVSLGLSPNWFTEEPDVMAPPASGLLPGTRGLLNGTVKKISEDPDSQYRILVNVPMFDPNGEGIWARLANFYATSGAGAFFLPEVGDEVVIGFLNEDPRCPIILGSLYSNTNIKPFQGLDPNEKNSLKAIVSKSGINIRFDDENKVLTIETPQKNTFTLSDKDKQISIKDENQNSIVMSSSGISIKSPKTISFEANQSISMKGNMGINIQASGGDVSVKGINIKESADMQYSASGGMTAKIDAGMELTLRGAMIMIN